MFGHHQTSKYQGSAILSRCQGNAQFLPVAPSQARGLSGPLELASPTQIGRCATGIWEQGGSQSESSKHYKTHQLLLKSELLSATKPLTSYIN